MKIKRNEIIPVIIKNILLLLTAFIYLIPFYIAIINEFKKEKDIFASPLGIPFKNLTMDNLIRNFNSPNFNVLQAYLFTIGLVVVTDSGNSDIFNDVIYTEQKQVRIL